MDESKPDELKPVECIVTSDPDRYPQLHFTRLMKFDRVPVAGEWVELYIPTLGDTTLVKVHSVAHRQNKKTFIIIEF